MNKRSITLSVGTALILSISSASVFAMGAPVNGQPVRAIEPVQPIKDPPKSEDKPSTGTASGGGSNLSVVPGGTGSDSNGTNGGLGGGPVPIKHLIGKPLDVCKGRQKAINVILARVVKRGTNQMNFFGQIATKVEGYVTTNNLTVPNYSTLTAAVTSDQTTVQTDINTLKANDTFNCDGNNPTSTASTIKSELKQEVNDLQTYRKDVKNLIVAVIAVAKSNQSSSSSSSSSSGGNQ